MWQLIPWVSRRRQQQVADQAVRRSGEGQRAEHDAAIRRIFSQARRT